MSYSPKINKLLVEKLYKLKLSLKRPMTQMVNEAITDYLQKHETITLTKPTIKDK